MTEAVRTRVTADEFFQMSFNDGKAELVRGEVIRMSPTGGEHGVVAMRIGARLWAHVEARKLGEVCAAETGFIVARDPDTVRAPDAAFISKERIGDIPRPKKFWPFAPDLAVEVISPSDTAEEVEAKVREWFAGGTRMVWVLYPTPGTIHVYHSPTSARVLEQTDTLTGNDVVPGFSCLVADMFA